VDLERELGANGQASTQKFSLYIPDKDRHGNPVPERERWIAAAMRLFAEINDGATRLPTAQGIWDPPGEDPPVEEATDVIYSFIIDAARFEANLERLAVFIHSFGKHTDQHTVMVEFAGEVPGRGFVSRAYFISDYTMAGERPF
jgi:hypothetical protein